jgi:hypothetical protein
MASNPHPNKRCCKAIKGNAHRLNTRAMPPFLIVHDFPRKKTTTMPLLGRSLSGHGKYIFRIDLSKTHLRIHWIKPGQAIPIPHESSYLVTCREGPRVSSVATVQAEASTEAAHPDAQASVQNLLEAIAPTNTNLNEFVHGLWALAEASSKP